MPSPEQKREETSPSAHQRPDLADRHDGRRGIGDAVAGEEPHHPDQTALALSVGQQIAIGRVVRTAISGLLEDHGTEVEGGSPEVLNGIAWDPEGKRLFVTGKNWPNLFEIRVLD